MENCNCLTFTGVLQQGPKYKPLFSGSPNPYTSQFGSRREHQTFPHLALVMGTGKKLHAIGIMLWNPWPFLGSWTHIVQKEGNQMHPHFPPSALLRIPVGSRNFALLQALWVRINALTAQVMDCNIPDIQDEKNQNTIKNRIHNIHWNKTDFQSIKTDSPSNSTRQIIHLQN